MAQQPFAQWLRYLPRTREELIQRTVTQEGITQLLREEHQALFGGLTPEQQRRAGLVWQESNPFARTVFEREQHSSLASLYLQFGSILTALFDMREENEFSERVLRRHIRATRPLLRWFFLLQNGHGVYDLAAYQTAVAYTTAVVEHGRPRIKEQPVTLHPAEDAPPRRKRTVNLPSDSLKRQLVEAEQKLDHLAQQLGGTVERHRTQDTRSKGGLQIVFIDGTGERHYIVEKRNCLDWRSTREPKSIKSGYGQAILEAIQQLQTMQLLARPPAQNAPVD